MNNMKAPPFIVTDSSITVVWEGKPSTVSVDSPNFESLKDVLLNGNYEDVPKYLSIKTAVVNLIAGKLRIENDRIYYDSFEVKGPVAQKLLSFLKAGLKNSSPLEKFIINLMRNSSMNSVESLYSFLEYKELPITADGNVIGYKGVGADYNSISGNTSTIVLKGRVDSGGHIYNGVGEEIIVDRKCVDDNREHHCSNGLHVGSYDYAKDWARSHNGRLLMVEFDPADAVSVPTDCSFQKLRVCRYKVISELPMDAAPSQEVVAGEAPKVSKTHEQNAADVEDLAAKTYIQRKLDDEVCPSVKEVQSRMKGSTHYRTCDQIIQNCERLGYEVWKSSSHKSNWTIGESDNLAP